MPTVVIGTAGHIDHGKTALLRALTGIDADRLPEERARGMTIDVGYAHLDLPDGSSLDFVDVPGHDRLVGNMLVGAGEIDAALVVVAADDGPRAQTFEHLELLDALDVRDGVAAVTKIDLVDAGRLAEVITATRDALARTALAGLPVLAVSASTGDGVPELMSAVVALRDRVVVRAAGAVPGPLRLSIDRSFTLRGRGTVVTGTLRGGSLTANERLRLEPGGKTVRVRELQVHNATTAAHDGGRTAINLADVDAAEPRRGGVLTRGPGIEVSDRLLVVLRPPVGFAGATPAARDAPWPPRDGTEARLHLGTEQVTATVARRGLPDALPDPANGTVGTGPTFALLRLDAPVATFVGDRGVLRGISTAGALAGARVLDPVPPRGVSRRRARAERLAELMTAIETGHAGAAGDALVRLHGAIPTARLAALGVALGVGLGGADRSTTDASGLVLAPDVTAGLEAHALELVADHHRRQPLSQGPPLGEIRTALTISLRRAAAIDRADRAAAATAVDGVIEGLVRRGRVVRDGDRVRSPDREAGPAPELAAAMDRVETMLAVPAPPLLREAAATAGCPPEGIRSLLASGRLVQLEPDLAWAAGTYRDLTAIALALAREGPLTPAAFRDATGTSRRYVLAILEDLGRRGILQRTPDGHVPGPRAPR
jgi:selenocysteine-specific elongation factor